jgi:hypothetical protein
MRRPLAVLAGLALSLLMLPTTAAHAVGLGACTITGTIVFKHSAATPEQGTWDITPGVIQCRGQFNTYELMVRDGSFTGSGSYTALPSGEGMCLRQLGEGTVDYWIPTDKQDVHVKEPNVFTLAGAGTFTTPTLRGAFEMPLYEGNCLTESVTRSVFLAQVSFIRTSIADFTP